GAVGDDRLRDDARILRERELDLVGAAGAGLVGGRVPVLVAHEQGPAAGRVGVQPVRAAGHRCGRVGRGLAGGLGGGGEGGRRGDPAEVAVGAVEVEHEREIGRGLDRVEVLAGEWAGVVLAALEQHLVVGQPACELGGEGALEAVLHGRGGDRGAVLELQPLLKGEGPGRAVVRGGADVGREVGDQLGGGIGGGLPRGEAAGGQAQRGDGEVLAGGGVEAHLVTGGEDGEAAAPALPAAVGAGAGAGAAARAGGERPGGE